jgi:hypothetical protein
MSRLALGCSEVRLRDHYRRCTKRILGKHGCRVRAGCQLHHNEIIMITSLDTRLSDT